MIHDEMGAGAHFTKDIVAWYVARDFEVSAKEIERAVGYHLLRMEKLGHIVVVKRGHGRVKSVYAEPLYQANAKTFEGS